MDGAIESYIVDSAAVVGLGSEHHAMLLCVIGLVRQEHNAVLYVNGPDT